MSHQSGIQASDELRKFFAKAKGAKSNIRYMKITIENEQLTLKSHGRVRKAFSSDYEHYVPPELDAASPCYIIVRFDSRDAMEQFEWLFVSYTPEDAHVRLKMLYASTRATLKREFGGSHIKEELFGTLASDVNLQGLRQHCSSSSSNEAPPPMTSTEEDLHALRQSQSSGDHTITSPHTMRGVLFPLSKHAKDALDDVARGRLAYVQLSIDLKNETINLEKRLADCDIDELGALVPAEAARYHVFIFKHKHDGATTKSTLFIYSMPGQNCSVKERMIYSSCKAPLLDQSEREHRLHFDKKLEIDDGAELTRSHLLDQLYPKQHYSDAVKKFDKPKGPSGRGPRRMIR